MITSLPWRRRSLQTRIKHHTSHSLCDTTAQQQQQQQQKNGSTQTPKTKTIFATTRFPQVPGRPDSPVFKFANTSARHGKNDP
jgi:hypothetical protein